MSGIINKVEHALHLDKKEHGTSHTHTPGTTTGTTGYSGTAEGVAGPHSSRAANAADPRVDSDLDGSRNAGAYGTTTGSGLTGSHNTTGAGYGTTGTTTGAGYGSSNTTAGPHSSNLANKVDPRVDSDLDGSRNFGAAQTGTTTTGTTGYSGGRTGNSATGTTNTGLTGNTGTHGGISNSTNAGPHDSNLANKVDPRVDSDLDSAGNRHGATTHGGILGSSGTHATPGSGTAQNTAGPHNSDLANKLDPRVDADLDGSKTYGGNRTHA